MQNRATKVILAGLATLSVGVGAASTIAAASNDHSALLSATKQVAQESMLKQQAQRANAAAESAEAATAGRAVQTAQAAAAGTAAAAAMKAAVAKDAAAAKEAAAKQAAAKQAAAKQAAAKEAAAKEAAAKAMPNGVSTVTSFWDPETASGRPMSYRTLASPYWPLGTKVKITYGNKSTIGVVDDFGPAEWAVAQHKIPAIVDMSSPMMASLSGSSEDTVVAKFQVVEWGKGGTFRTSGTGYDRAYGHAA